MSRTQTNADQQNSERNDPIDVALEIDVDVEVETDRDVRFRVHKKVQVRSADHPDEATDQDVRESIKNEGDRR